MIAGVVIEQRFLENFTREFMDAKAHWYPNLVEDASNRLDRILPEIKGADLRRALREGGPRRNRRHAVGFLDSLMDLLEGHDARTIGRIWIKEPGRPCNARAIYTFSVQDICADFQNLLATVGEDGLVIADSRTPGLNASVAHSVFTQKFSSKGDRYPRIQEMPLFGHSQNHAGIQVADLLCSALLFPMAARCYCYPHIQSVHVDTGFGQLANRYGDRLKAIQHRYTDDSGRRRGGLTVSDPVTHKGGSPLFKPV